MVHTFLGYLILTTSTFLRIFSRVLICFPLPMPEKHGTSRLLRILTNFLPVRKCKIDGLHCLPLNLQVIAPLFSRIFAFFLSSVTMPGMAFRALETFSPPSVLVLQAKFDSRPSQLDDSPWRTDVTSITSKGSASSSITSSINSSSASSPRLRIICRSSNTDLISPPWAAIFVFLFHYSQSLSASRIAQEPSWCFTAHSFLRSGLTKPIKTASYT